MRLHLRCSVSTVSSDPKNATWLKRWTYPNQRPLSIDPLLTQLHRRQILYEHPVRHRQEAPDPYIRARRSGEAGILQRLRVLVDQAVEDGGVLRLEAVGGAVEAAGVGGEGEVGLGGDPVGVAVLFGEVGGGGEDLGAVSVCISVDKVEVRGLGMGRTFSKREVPRVPP